MVALLDLRRILNLKKKTVVLELEEKHKLKKPLVLRVVYHFHYLGS